MHPFMFFLTCFGITFHYVTCDALPDIQSDSTSSLLTMLKKFKGARNHESQPQGKREARDYIIETFKNNGLDVWTERAKIGESLYGENIVGMIRSDKTGTADDKIVIVGAHYDTTPNTTGIDDNGSGTTALLQVAKNIGGAKCKVNNTILFVAFDFEEWTDECEAKPQWPIACGSDAYVKNLTTYLAKTGGAVGGALILETIVNHNTSANSEILPHGFDTILTDAYNEVKNDLFRGNFLAVVGRNESDKTLLSLMQKYFEKDADYRAQLMSIPISGRPSVSPIFKYYDHFYRSDHYSFWNANTSYSALMLTDTADFRGYMIKCYHKYCDNLVNVKEDDLEFLRRTINAIIKTVLDLSKADSCKSVGFSPEMSFNWFLTLAMALGALLWAQ